MKPTKPARFERVVRKLADRGMPDYDEFVVADHEVTTLLRKEHQAVVRIVKSHLKKWKGYNIVDPTAAYGRKCRSAQCEEILSQLTRRAR